MPLKRVRARIDAARAQYAVVVAAACALAFLVEIAGVVLYGRPV